MIFIRDQQIPSSAMLAFLSAGLGFSNLTALLLVSGHRPEMGACRSGTHPCTQYRSSTMELCHHILTEGISFSRRPILVDLSLYSPCACGKG